MTPRGNTVLPEGLAWGWRVLSPTVPFTQGAAYNDKKWRKVVVFMTDGENDVSNGTNTLNGSVYTSYGYVTTTLAKNRFGTTNTNLAEPALDTKLLTVCSGIKAKAEMRPNPKNNNEMIPSIELYSIAFKAPSQRGDSAAELRHEPRPLLCQRRQRRAAQGSLRAIGERLKTMYLSE